MLFFFLHFFIFIPVGNWCMRSPLSLSSNLIICKRIEMMNKFMKGGNPNSIRPKCYKHLHNHLFMFLLFFMNLPCPVCCLLFFFFRVRFCIVLNEAKVGDDGLFFCRFEQVNNATARVMTNKKVANPYTNGKKASNCVVKTSKRRFMWISCSRFFCFFFRLEAESSGGSCLWS